MSRRYWLLKSEPDCYSIDDLKRDGSTAWTGIRNYQARNFMRDLMQAGDRALFYHSSAEPPAIVGVCEIGSTSFTDDTQFDPKDEHFDPKATAEKPIWCAVEVKYLKHLPKPISLAEAKQIKGLEKMELLKKGQRLSVLPVTEEEFKIITSAK